MSLVHSETDKNGRRPRLVFVVVVALVAFGAGLLVSSWTMSSRTGGSATTTTAVQASTTNPNFDTCLIGPIGPSSSLYQVNLRGFSVDLVAPNDFYCEIVDGSPFANITLQGNRHTSRDAGQVSLEATGCQSCVDASICDYSAYWAKQLMPTYGKCLTGRPAGERVTYLVGNSHTRQLTVLLQEPAGSAPPLRNPVASTSTWVLALEGSGPSAAQLVTFSCYSTDAHANYCRHDAVVFARTIGSRDRGWPLPSSITPVTTTTVASTASNAGR